MSKRPLRRLPRTAGRLWLCALVFLPWLPLGPGRRAGPSPRLAGAAPTEHVDAVALAEGMAPMFRLSRRTPHQRLVFEVPATATRIDVLVLAAQHGSDIDVYLRRGRPFGLDPRREAEIVGRTTAGIEHVTVDGPLAPGTWYAWVELESTSRATAVSTFLSVAPGPYADVWFPGDTRPLRTARDGHAGWAGRFLLTGDEVANASFTLEVERDGLDTSPEMERALEGGKRLLDSGLVAEIGQGSGEVAGRVRVQVQGAARRVHEVSTWSLQLLDWSIARPDGAAGIERDDDLACTLSIGRGMGYHGTATAMPLDEPTDSRRGGARGRVHLSGDTDQEELQIDVPAGMRHLRIVAKPNEDVDIDLYVRAGKPSDDRTEDADWYGISLGAEEIVVAGGEGELPAGAWYVTAELIDDAENVRVDIEAAWSAEPVERTSRAPLEPGRFVRGRVEPDRTPTAWYRLDVPKDAVALGAQVWRATGALDVMLVRPRDGSILARAFTPRPDERFEWTWGAPLASATSLWLGVTSPDPYEEETNFEVAWDVGRAPLPDLPTGWPPPGRRRSGEPLPRSQAACVEITLDDGSGGSGACVSRDGYVLTCRHVLEPEGEPGLQDEGLLIAFPARTDRPPVHAFFARLVDSDEDLDLALLKIERDVFGRPLDPQRPLPFLELGDSGALELGAPVTVYGYPADGSERNRTPLTLSRGVVAGLESDAHGTLRWIKTDAWVGPGHSGGVLTDVDGRFLGVPAATLGDLEVLGLVVPLSVLPAPWRARILYR